VSTKLYFSHLDRLIAAPVPWRSCASLCLMKSRSRLCAVGTATMRTADGFKADGMSFCPHRWDRHPPHCLERMPKFSIERSVFLPIAQTSCRPSWRKWLTPGNRFLSRAGTSPSEGKWRREMLSNHWSVGVGSCASSCLIKSRSRRCAVGIEARSVKDGLGAGAKLVCTLSMGPASAGVSCNNAGLRAGAIRSRGWPLVAIRCLGMLLFLVFAGELS
jgi:hypothetical protein